MSVLGPLLDFSRAIIHAHNNAKVRNLMDLPRAQTEANKKRPSATNGEGHFPPRRDRQSK
ncbi:hypothetical protein [Mesorhizobium atlanticum]|uniref:Uncharacterized protein n=1 Tax=Mesorhizobium atlanticum TaxID=2233532 RepID=A0A330GN31_9HYPH|nr:hypothetical protein [Mesorhizobium atlanticum]RAZ74813.1 hypothetical protein DPM35_17860 [Mesorhizobium atlanticum]